MKQHYKHISDWRSLIYPGALRRRVLRQLVRLRDGPHTVALGFATGIFASFTPFIGFHFIIAGLIAWALRANILAALLGTVAGNPLTFPLIWSAAWYTGSLMTSARAMPEGIGDIFALDSFIRLMIGGVPLGILAGALAYVSAYMLMLTFYSRREQRRKNRMRSPSDATEQRPL